jgi:hypothetical protein
MNTEMGSINNQDIGKTKYPDRSRPNPNEAPGKTAVIVPQKKILSNHLNFESSVGFNGGAQKRGGLKLVLWMWTAATIDYLLILAASLLALVLFSIIVSSSTVIGDSLKLLLKPKKINSTFFFLVVAMGWTYFVVVRSFIGASVGEWFCNLRLGRPSERLMKRYVLRLILRTGLVIITGLFTIPILSLIFRRDVAGKLSGGLYIYSLK